MRVGDDIVVIGRCHAAGKAEPVCRDGRGPAGKNRCARVARITVDIDQNVDAVGGDHGRRLVIGKAADLRPLPHCIADAGTRAVLARYAAVVGMNVEAAAVMQFHHLGQAEADRMLAQIGRYIADPQARRALSPAVGVVMDLRGPRNRLAGIAGIAGELEQRVVEHHRHRERRDVGQKALGLDTVPALDDRPLALPLAQRNPVLHRLGLLRRKIDGLVQRIFSSGIRMVELEHPAQLVQRHDLVADGSAIDGRHAVDERQPLADGGARLPQVLQRAAKVDVGGVKLRIDPQRIAQRIDGGEGISCPLCHDSHVEVRSGKMRIIRMKGDPSLVEIRGGGGTLRLLEVFGLTE